VHLTGIFARLPWNSFVDPVTWGKPMKAPMVLRPSYPPTGNLSDCTCGLAQSFERRQNLCVCHDGAVEWIEAAERDVAGLLNTIRLQHTQDGKP
jgi:hypothetical protein